MLNKINKNLRKGMIKSSKATSKSIGHHTNVMVNSMELFLKPMNPKSSASAEMLFTGKLLMKKKK